MPALRRRVAIALIAVTAASLAACVAPTTRRAPLDDQLVVREQEKQREIAVAYSARKYERLYQVGYPLLKAAAPLCASRQRPGMGYLLISRYDFSPEMRAAATRVFNIHDGLRVFRVLPGSPAERAGLREGDELISVDNFRVSHQQGEERRLNDYLRRGSPSAPRRFSVVRDGRPLTVTVRPEAVCDYGLGVIGSDAVNALADGDNVIVTKGMMRFAETNQELGLVVSHELAHNVMDHVDAKRTNATGGLILDILAAAAGVNTRGTFQNIAAGVYSQEFEAEADYVGMYIMARADQPIRGAADFWRRMAAEHPQAIARDGASSHPASAERFVALEHTATEIERKRASGRPLLPELHRR